MVRWQEIQDLLDGRAYRRRNTNSSLSAFIFGATIGVAAGVLLAPRSGQETREKLKQKAQEQRGIAKERAARASEVAKRSVAEGKRAAQESKTRTGRRGSNEGEA